MLEFIGHIAEYINNCLFGVTLPLVVLVAGIFFFFALRGAFFLHPVRAVKLIFKRGQSGESPLRSLSLALAGTLGVGNIAGVTLALMTGGAGAVFWMWVSSFAAMLIKFAEITLALEFRESDGNAMLGGAPYYIRRLPFGKWIASAFAGVVVVCSLAMGGVLQSNTVAECAEGLFDIPPLVIGIAMLVPTAIVIEGGGKKISTVTSYVIPLLTAAYTVMALVAVASRAEQLPAAFEKILSSAFDFSSAGGGVLGFFFSKSVQTGISRGLLSNEAGCGTAPIAHASEGSVDSAKQGLFGVLEVFIDTCLLCTLTALVVLTAFDGAVVGGGMTITALAFGVTFGDAASYIIAVSVFMFAYSTIICWYYYGETSLRYLTPSVRAKNIFLFLYVAAVPIGALSAPDAVWKLNDLMVSVMCTVNVAAIVAHHKRIKRSTIESGIIGQKTRRTERSSLPLPPPSDTEKLSPPRCTTSRAVLCRRGTGRGTRGTSCGIRRASKRS